MFKIGDAVNLEVGDDFRNALLVDVLVLDEDGADITQEMGFAKLPELRGCKPHHSYRVEENGKVMYGTADADGVCVLNVVAG